MTKNDAVFTVNHPLINGNYGCQFPVNELSHPSVNHSAALALTVFKWANNDGSVEFWKHRLPVLFMYLYFLKNEEL